MDLRQRIIAAGSGFSLSSPVANTAYHKCEFIWLIRTGLLDYTDWLVAPVTGIKGVLVSSRCDFEWVHWKLKERQDAYNRYGINLIYFRASLK